MLPLPQFFSSKLGSANKHGLHAFRFIAKLWGRGAVAARKLINLVARGELAFPSLLTIHPLSTSIDAAGPGAQNQSTSDQGEGKGRRGGVTRNGTLHRWCNVAMNFAMKYPDNLEAMCVMSDASGLSC